ncbi:MAG: hypothetical protein QM690_17245 [Sphingobium sp.]
MQVTALPIIVQRGRFVATSAARYSVFPITSGKDIGHEVTYAALLILCSKRVQFTCLYVSGAIVPYFGLNLGKSSHEVCEMIASRMLKSPFPLPPLGAGAELKIEADTSYAFQDFPMIKSLLSTLSVVLALAGPMPAQAQSDSDKPEETANVALTPETLGDALSCRSHEAALAFASTLFLDRKPLSWMRETKDDKNSKGMLGLYGYKLAKPVSLLGEPVTHVYFMKDWVVTLWPREKAEAFIAAQKMERAPIKIAEQYFRFIDPESGPMLGAFEPTGNSTAMMLAKAFGGEMPPSPPADSLFVGCNYAPASQADFLEVARQSEAMMDDAARDLGAAAETDTPP